MNIGIGKQVQPDSTTAGARPEPSNTSLPRPPDADKTIPYVPGILLLGEHSSLLSKVRRSRQNTDTVQIPNANRMISAVLSKQNGMIEDRRASYRHWLEDMSKEDLIKMLMGMEGEPPPFEITQKLLRNRVQEAQSPSPAAYQLPEDMKYIRLPAIRTAEANELMPTWQIALVSLDTNNTPLGLLIDSEITIGRAAGDAMPDLDLMPYGAATSGVSRIHARLRPTWNRLWLIDNNSNNGTYWNRLRIPNEVEQPLKEGDVIAFGRLNFLVKIVRSPNKGGTKTLL